MKPLKYTLSFILGFILSPIILLIAIIGVVAGIGATVKMKDLPLNLDAVIAPESAIYDQTLLEAVQGVLGDVQNFDKLSMKDLYEHYGISLFKELSGLDLSQKEFWSAPLTSIIEDVSIITNELTLADIEAVAKTDFDSYDLPILKENMNVSLKTALDNIMGSFNGNISIRFIKDKLGIDLGVEDNEMLATMQDLRLSDFGNVINYLRVNTLLDADTDLFIKTGAQQVYVKADRYEQVSSPSDLSVGVGVKTYIAGVKTVGDKTVLDIREQRYVQKVVDGETTYVVDNSCYNEGYENDGNTFYRFVEYAPVSASGVSGEKYILAYANQVESVERSSFTLVQGKFLPLSELFDPAKDNASFSAAVENGKVTINRLSLSDGGKFVESVLYGMTDEVVGLKSVLSEKEDGNYLRAHIGDAEVAIQSIAYMTINDLKDAGDLLGNRKLKELISINEDNNLLWALRNSTLNTIADDVDGLCFGDILDIIPNKYSENENGAYVLVDGAYVVYNPAIHSADLQRYDRLQTEGASSLVLQHLGAASIDTLDDFMKGLSIADVIDLHPDVYRKATAEEIEEYRSNKDSAIKLFEYDAENGVFKLADRDHIAGEEYFVVDIKGDSNSILKKLVFVKIEKMDSALEIIMDDCFLSELVDINSAYAVTLDETSHSESSDPYAQYFYEWKEGRDNSVYIKNGKISDDKTGKKALFVLDDNGSYFMSDKKYFLASDDEKGAESETIYFTYEKLADNNDFKNDSSLIPGVSNARTVALKYAAAYNLYYSTDGGITFDHNIPLCSYLAAGIENKNSEVAQKLYYRKKAEGPNVGVKEGKYYANEANLFVDIAGNMVSTNKKSETDMFEDETYKLVYCDLPRYILKTRDIEGGEMGFFVEISDRKYEYMEGIATYSLEYCEDIYVTDANGDFVLIDGAFIEDTEKKYPDEQRYSVRCGVVSQSAQVFFSGGKTPFNAEDVCLIKEVIQEASSPVLRYLANSTVKNLNEKLSDAKISDILEVAPGTIFDVEALRESTLSDLGASVQVALNKDITIGDLLNWGQVDMIPAEVVEVIKGATIHDFFANLKFDITRGMIYVDVETLVEKSSHKEP